MDLSQVPFVSNVKSFWKTQTPSWFYIQKQAIENKMVHGLIQAVFGTYLEFVQLSAMF